MALIVIVTMLIEFTMYNLLVFTKLRPLLRFSDISNTHLSIAAESRIPYPTSDTINSSCHYCYSITRPFA